MTTRLLFVLAVLAAAFSAHAADPPAHRDSVAVVIGNKSYQGRIPEVAYAHRDADAMKAYLVQVLGYREGNIIDLRDATKSQMESAFGNRASHQGKVWRFMRPGVSHVTVFYSGHGVPGLKDKRGYLLPVDADPDTPEINGYPVDLLYENLGALEAASVTVYLDACFSGESDRGMLIRSASPVFVQAQAPQVTEGLTVLSAASAEQVASWDEENQHGLFTWHLLQALQGAADTAPFGDGDGTVTVSETRAYLDSEMTYAARRRFGRVQNASVRGDDETVLGVASEEPVTMPAAVAALSPSFQVEEMDKIMVVAEVRVNTRSGPGTGFDKVESLSRGTEVEVTGKVEGQDWYRIALAGGQVAYIYAPLLRDALPAPVDPAVGSFPAKPAPGESFQDCDICPEMVVVPAGSLQMGSPSYEEGRRDWEDSLHRVAIPHDFAVSKFEITKEQFRVFIDETGYVASQECSTNVDDEWDYRANSWRDPGYYQDGRHPVVCVTFTDVSRYLDWLSAKAGVNYRPLTEAEWEYAARAGTTTARYWGDDPNLGCAYANVRDQTLKNTFSHWSDAAECHDNYVRTSPVGSYRANSFGLHDMLGNVWEWTADCWNENYNGAPSDGSAWTAGDCGKRVVRGGTWFQRPTRSRSANRGWSTTDYAGFHGGFRVARDLD